MYQSTFLVVLAAITVVHCYGAIQVQMPEAAELQQPDEDLQAQIKELQKNVTDIWNYMYRFRSVMSQHLTHLRQHQVELESSVHKMEHLHESDMQPNMHHHSGEQHSHSGEHHSHSGEHGHSHGAMESHSHGDEQNSYSLEHHSHSDEHGHHSHSHSHTSHDQDDHSHGDHSDSHSHGDHSDSHSHGDHDAHHGHDHKDSHETEDVQQQTQKAADPLAEPIVTASNRQEHSHHHHHHHQYSRTGSADNFNPVDDFSYHHHDHHSHHDSRSSNVNRTVVLPRYSDYGLYDLAMCRMVPNTALPTEQQQNIFGTITMWQKKTGGTLNLHLQLQGFDVGDHHGHHQQSVQQEGNETPQPVGHRHGFHVHANGDLSNGCQSTGPHYNPKGVNHGTPNGLDRHVGDLGNIECDEHGNTNVFFSDEVASLKGQYSIIGKALVINANEDDLGLGGNAESLKTGNAGTRLACCVIEKIDKIPIRQYKVMKNATQLRNV